MKQFLLFLVLALCLQVQGQPQPFRFAFISDTHIGSPSGAAEEDLRRAVADINALEQVDFVVLTGDITELGKNEELLLAKRILDSLRIPYYIIPGNHDTGWSESGGEAFTKTFGNDRFWFDHKGVRFIGCASGPYVRMSDGHVPRSHMIWLQEVIRNTPAQQPIVFLNHYPLDPGLDNWYEVIDLLRTRNTIAVLCGHGHANRKMNFEGLPAVMGRSNLRAKAKTGGFNIVELNADSITFSEKKHQGRILAPWASIRVQPPAPSPAQRRIPGFEYNEEYSQVKPAWVYHSAANVISTPAVIKDLVVFGNQEGTVEALSIGKGKRKWKFQAGGAIYSSPTVTDERIIFGSADSFVYCLNSRGKLQWKLKTGAAVLGSPLVHGDTVFIGGSDHSFRALRVKDGSQLWQYQGLKGAVVSQPLLYDNKVIFGAWDTWLYALNSRDGSLAWKWTNGSSVINFSPAACIPVARDGVVYIAAPDRYLTAIDAGTGATIWRSRAAGVRESLGISEDGSLIYGKTMNDTIVAFRSGRTPVVAWKLHAGYGYEHVPSMLVAQNGLVYFGTRSGVVYAIDNQGRSLQWRHKIDNSMVNTVRVLSGNRVLASTMDGRVALLTTGN